MSLYVVKPVEAWPGKETPPSRRRRSPFKANWTGVMNNLERELRQLRGRDVTLHMYVRDGHIRQDGQIRADARPSSPGVILEFYSNLKGVRFRFAADTFGFWQDNVDAIVRTLEALRMIDRYGVTSGQQYEGFRALPAKGSTTMTTEVAKQAIRDMSGMAGQAALWTDMIRAARNKVHPDRPGGSHEQFLIVQQAEKTLRDAGLLG